MIGVLLVLILFKSPHAIGLFVFLEFFLPSEILLTSTFALSATRVVYILGLFHVIRNQIRFNTKKHPIAIVALIVLFIVMLFYSYDNTVTKVVSVGNPFYYFITSTVPNFLLPGVVVYFMVQSKNDFKVLIQWLILLVIIWTFFGFYEIILKQNFFIDQLIKEFPKQAGSVVTGYHYSDVNRFGTTARIQGTVWHPISFGGRICCILGVLLLVKSIFPTRGNKGLILFVNIAIIMIFICVALTVSRSVWLFALMVYVLFVYYKSTDRKLKFGFLIFVGVIFLAAFYAELQETLFNKVQGSSVDMRVSQANSVAKIVSNNYLLGLGQQYTSSYIAKYGLYTDTFGFESFLFVALLDSGLIGIAYYVIFFVMIIYAQRKVRNTDVKNAIKYLTISYIVFIVLTGEMETLWLYWLSINIVCKADSLFLPAIFAITQSAEDEIVSIT
ncbi:MAG: O-antigen ligase family protein [Bacteroidia bacterium]